MSDHYREVTTTSWGKRIVGAFMGIIFGILLFIGSFPLIWWNEGRSVDRIKTLDEGRGIVLAVSADTVDTANNNALIHISGNAVTNDILKDSFFGVEENALKLKRIVEMYQWKESAQTKTTNNLGGSETRETIYTYHKTWSETLISSSQFKRPEGHKNPPSMPYQSKAFTASSISVGAFNLSNPFVNQINDFTDYPLSQQNFNTMDTKLHQYFKMNGNEYFYGDPINPKIGSIRISYDVIKPLDVSVIGKQNNALIETYFTKNGEIKLLENGNVAAQTMFSSAETENTLITWLIRLGAFFMMSIGLGMVLRPIKVIGDVVPFFGSLLGAGISFIAGSISLVLCFVTMALAWLFFRPLIGGILLIAAGGFLFGGFKLMKEKLKNVSHSGVQGTVAHSSTPPRGKIG